MGYEKPIPVPSPESKPFWAAVHEHRLELQRCDDCGKFWFPPSLLCPHCLSENSAWTPVSGKGEVFSFVVFHRVYHPGFSDDVPYTVALIELDEGPRMLANLRGIAPGDVKCGLRVHAVFEDVTDDTTIPQFTVD